jgi:hypothetical protein
MPEGRKAGTWHPGEYRPFLVGFLKVHNELLKGNLARVLENLSEVCDIIAVCDDGSYDGSAELLASHPKIPADLLLTYDSPSFNQELERKETLLERVLAYRPQWIFWLDGDEALDAHGLAGLRSYLRRLPSHIQSVDMAEANLWLSERWARTDSLWGKGNFCRCWRGQAGLHFLASEGLHRPQFPVELLGAPSATAPFSVLHFGFSSRSHQRFKILQYATTCPEALPRLPYAAEGEFELIDSSDFPWPVSKDAPRPPPAVGEEYIAAVMGIGLVEDGLGIVNGTSKLCVVTISTYNQGASLPGAIDSVLAQTCPKWILLVVDDASDDDTAAVVAGYMEEDPRIFYLRYPEKRGRRATSQVSRAVAARWAPRRLTLRSNGHLAPTRVAREVRRCG